MRSLQLNPSNSARLLYELATSSVNCASEAEFVHLVRNVVRPLIPSKGMIAAIGQIDLDHIELLRLLPVDYPADALASIRRTSNLRDRKAITTWLQFKEPFLVQFPNDAAMLSPLEQLEIESFGLGRIGAHGVLDLIAQSGSYFSFVGIPDDLPSAVVVHQLKLVVPHLHQALFSVHRANASIVRSANSLTSVEQELIRWIAAGRTNVEIAQIRGRSLSTVRNQIATMFRKLGVRNRAEAVRSQRFI